jgi:hypothetical protein
MRKALKTLLVADEPLGRSAIIERAGISESSYDRHLDELAALGMVESVGNGGHKRWQAWLVPWWSPLANADSPRTADTDENAVTPLSRWDDVLYEIALDLGCDPEYELFAWPLDIDEVFAALPALGRWREFFEAHYGLVDVENSQPAHEEVGVGALSAVEIGYDPTARASEQTAFDRTK